MAKNSVVSSLLRIPNFNVNAYPTATLSVVIILETMLSLFIIYKTPYTEIDWNAYMQEVKGVIDGDLNYANLRGDTGPLVYPAGFVYIYSALYFLTDRGSNILKAQYIFLLLHVCCIYVVVKLLMSNTRKLPLWVVIATCLSRRIHSIFVLRLFNDCFAVFFCYVALFIFCSNRKHSTSLTWSLGSVFYSFAVSIKMNILLYAPAIGLLYLKYLGFAGTVKQIMLCAFVQLVLGAPFLLTYPENYVTRAFNFSKDFEYKWTVNFKFISEETFLNKRFGHLLLLVLVTTLLATAHCIWCRKEGGLIGYVMRYWKVKKMQSPKKKQSNNKKKTNKKEKEKELAAVVSGEYFLDRLFLCNFVGIVFAKSLHFQFYVWYFHSIPYLAWRSTLPLVIKWILILAIEGVWNVFPSNPVSSIVLWICHLVLLCTVIMYQYLSGHKKLD